MAELPALACRLDALDRGEQSRRAALAEQITARFASVDETGDGYLARHRYDPTEARDALERMLLERRCCPFLSLELGFEPESETMWMRFGGGSGVKAFLTGAGLRARTASSSSCSRC
jgi:hypothetical protein